MHTHDEQVDRAVSCLYDAAVDPPRWQDALRTLAQVAEVGHAAMHDTNFANGVVHWQYLHNITSDDQQLYLRRYAAIDPRLRFLKVRRQRWFSDLDELEACVRESHPLYVEYLRPRGVGETLAGLYAIEGPRMGTLALLRHSGQAKADAFLLARLDRLLPHLDRATRIARRFASCMSELALVGSVLDGLQEPLACIDEDGRVRRHNLAFETQVDTGFPVQIRNGRLHFAKLSTLTQVMRAVRECCRIARVQYPTKSDTRLTCPVHKRDGSIAFVTVAPLVAGNARSWAGGPCALLRLDEYDTQPSAERIAQALGLTSGEARLVAALCQGKGLGNAARTLGISLNTAKTQLASAFGKTGTHRQSALIALVSTMPR